MTMPPRHSFSFPLGYDFARVFHLSGVDIAGWDFRFITGAGAGQVVNLQMQRDGTTCNLGFAAVLIKKVP